MADKFLKAHISVKEKAIEALTVAVEYLKFQLT